MTPRPRGGLHRGTRGVCPLCGEQGEEELYRIAPPPGTDPASTPPHRLLLCRSCGFGFTEPRPDEEQLATYYGDSAHASGAVYKSRDRGSRLASLLDERTRFIRAHLPAVETVRLLDVGASQGDLLRALESPGMACVGLEPSLTAVRQARDRGLDVREGTLEQGASLQLGKFHTVCLISVLEHLPEPRKALGSIKEVLEPDGGLLVVEVPDSTRPFVSLGEFYSTEHLNHFTRASLRRLLQSEGFRVVSLEASATVPNLRAAAVLALDAAIEADPGDAGGPLRDAVRAYREERRRFDAAFQERFRPLAKHWRQGDSRIALYGAGLHTRFLLRVVDFGDEVRWLFDGDAAKQGTSYLGLPVHPPESIPELDPDVIVISSHDFQEEIYQRIRHIAPGPRPEVIRCYPTPP